MLKLSPVRTAFVIGCGILFCFAVMGLVAFELWQRSWERELATLVATDDRIAPFGDCGGCSPTIEITPDAAHPVGEATVLGDLQITVIYSGIPKIAPALEEIPANQVFWSVEFVIVNLSSSRSRTINPKIASYVQGETHFYDYGTAELAPVLDQGWVELGPGEELYGILLYEIPSNLGELYWIYTDDSAKQAYVTYRLR